MIIGLTDQVLHKTFKTEVLYKRTKTTSKQTLMDQISASGFDKKR
jgi:hypothetical protein